MEKNTFNRQRGVVARPPENFLHGLRRLQERHGVTPAQLRAALGDHDVPLGIFTKQHGILEAVVLYLATVARLPTRDIAEALGRSESTIRNSYRQALHKGSIGPPEGLRVPLEVFAKRAPLHAITTHLREQGWRFADIARALRRDPRNISATYRRGAR